MAALLAFLLLFGLCVLMYEAVTHVQQTETVLMFIVLIIGGIVIVAHVSSYLYHTSEEKRQQEAQQAVGIVNDTPVVEVMASEPASQPINSGPEPPQESVHETIARLKAERQEAFDQLLEEVYQDRLSSDFDANEAQQRYEEQAAFIERDYVAKMSEVFGGRQ